MPVLLTPDRGLVASRFSAAAGDYDRHAGHQKLIAQKLLGLLDDIPCERVLELGCGTGILSEGLSRLFPKARKVFTDCAPGMVRACSDRVPPSYLVRHALYDFESADLPDTWDLVVSSCSLQWLSRPEAFPERLKHLLQPGGITAHAIPVRGMLREFEGSFLKAGASWNSLNYLTESQWRSLFTEEGFSILKSCTGEFTLLYRSPADALRALRGIGASLSGHRGSAVNETGMIRTALYLYGEEYGDNRGMVPVTYRVHFMVAEGPLR